MFFKCVKSGYSKSLLEFVHDGIMSPNGLSSTIANVRRRGLTRYYKLYKIFAERVRRIKAGNPANIYPLYLRLWINIVK
ncbi:hypothetical protein PF010_g21200 [Phytophthora fragariae]|nr:hypothetical protein PF010_g21200 [Phytophthora fragariae]